MNTLVYVGAGSHDLLRTLWAGYQDGLAYSRNHQAAAAVLEPDRVVEAATVACECKLHSVEPLDRAAFHPAYTYGWMAGYLAAHHDPDSHDLDITADGLALGEHASLDEHAEGTGAGRVVS